MKTLILIRHAKSSWDSPGQPDLERTLNKRGERDAPEMGKRLAKAGVKPDLLVTSPARRALRTARLIADEIGYPKKKIVEEPAIYEAGVNALKEVVLGLSDSAETVILVGHNPGFTDLLNLLTGSNVENVPTCGVATIEFEARAWREIEQGSGRLEHFDFPKREE